MLKSKTSQIGLACAELLIESGLKNKIYVFWLFQLNM
jgi:hypothetical protein